MRLALAVAFAMMVYSVIVADLVVMATASVAGGLWDQIAEAVAK